MTVSLVYEVDILENALLRNASGQRLLYLPLNILGCFQIMCLLGWRAA